MNFLQVLERLREKLKSLSIGKKFGIIIGIFLFSIFLSIIFKSLRYYNYEALFYGLSPEQTYEVIQKLKKKNIPYILEKDAGVIKVPSEKALEVKIELLGEGIGYGKIAGYEIFDKFQFGITDFEEKIRFKRALEGEISRTINGLKVVNGSRVHIVLPEEDIYGKKTYATASIMIDLKPGVKLSQTQIQGIVNLVVGSVPELSPENVSIVDTNSNVLYKGGPSPLGDKYASGRFEIQREIEDYIAFKVKSMLDKSLGYDKSIVQVSADLDFNKIESEEERYLPIVGDEGVLRSKESITERQEGKSQGEGGPVGTYSNTPFYSILRGETERVYPSFTSSSSPYSSEKEHTVVNYEVDKIVKRIVETPGNIKRLSVSVLVDGKYEKVGEGKKAKWNYIPRTPEEIKQIEQAVIAAAGINLPRGDTVSVQNIPFDKTYLEQEKEIMVKQKREEFMKWIFNKILAYIPIIILLIIFYIIIRKILTTLPKKVEKEEERKMGPVDLVREIGKERPELIAQLIKKWIRE
jgi:flagellar M-ring protein FliF